VGRLEIVVDIFEMNIEYFHWLTTLALQQLGIFK